MKNFLLLILCVNVFSVSAQKIEGRVFDDYGRILPFASILIKGTQQGVTANNEGSFSFTLPPGNYTLVCHYVGYASQEKNCKLIFNKCIRKL
jgi:hypothetical protein